MFKELCKSKGLNDDEVERDYFDLRKDERSLLKEKLMKLVTIYKDFDKIFVEFKADLDNHYTSKKSLAPKF